MTVEHERTLHRGAFGSWFTGCKSCPSWISQPEECRPDAIRHHTVHKMQALSVPAAPVLAVDVERVMSRLVGPIIMLVVLPVWLLATGGAL